MKPRIRRRKKKLALKPILQMAQLRAEKCELKEALNVYQLALKEAKRGPKKSWKVRYGMEAIAGLLRLSCEALDQKGIETWDRELDKMMSAHPTEIPPMAWYCKGSVARYRNRRMLAQRCFHRYLRMARKDPTLSDQEREEAVLKGWIMLAIVTQGRGRVDRALWLARELLTRYEAKNHRGLNGILYLLVGTLYERRKELRISLKWFQKAHAQCLADHNWYYHLYAIYGYARIARLQKNYSQAYWYLDLVDKAANGKEFGLLRREISDERNRLEQDAVDLLIDGRAGTIKTREVGSISLGKQYVLLNILEALSDAHRRSGNDVQRGLSKAEIIEAVWHEPYHPDEHDNKLYYNINRLRKLIEPNIRKPQYLLNWKEGYRLAPELRVHWVD